MCQLLMLSWPAPAMVKAYDCFSLLPSRDAFLPLTAKRNFYGASESRPECFWALYLCSLLAYTPTRLCSFLRSPPRQSMRHLFYGQNIVCAGSPNGELVNEKFCLPVSSLRSPRGRNEVEKDFFTLGFGSHVINYGKKFARWVVVCCALTDLLLLAVSDIIE
jgi:hypothetical protein